MFITTIHFQFHAIPSKQLTVLFLSRPSCLNANKGSEMFQSLTRWTEEKTLHSWWEVFATEVHCVSFLVLSIWMNFGHLNFGTEFHKSTRPFIRMYHVGVETPHLKTRNNICCGHIFVSVWKWWLRHLWWHIWTYDVRACTKQDCLAHHGSGMEVSEFNNYANTSIIFLMNHTASMCIHVYINTHRRMLWV